MRRVLLIGASGQLGADLAARLAGPLLVAPPRDRLDVTDAAAVDRAVADVQPDIVVNTAAELVRRRFRRRFAQL